MMIETVWLAPLILALVTVQRLTELVLARVNTKRLLAQGAQEHGAGHYPVMIAIHAAWMIGLIVLGWDNAVNALFLALYLTVFALRVWSVSSLGRRWTTRIIVVPGETLVARGPYRFIPHPNYVVVSLEIVLLPLVFGLIWFAIVFTALNAAILTVRIRAENKALAGLRKT